MSINYESAWKHLKLFVSDMESCSKPYKGNGFQAVLHKMEDLEKALTTEEPKDDDTLPDVKIGDYTFLRSKLPKFTKEDFEEAKKAAEKFSVSDFAEAARIINGQKLYTDVINQFVDEKTKDVDRIVFDCFQQHLGCKNADDVFAILTSPVMFHKYNGILKCINTRLAWEVGPLGSPSGMRYIKLGEMTEPATGSPEMLETLRTRWEEVYNEN